MGCIDPGGPVRPPSSRLIRFPPGFGVARLTVPVPILSPAAHLQSLGVLARRSKCRKLAVGQYSFVLGMLG